MSDGIVITAFLRGGLVSHLIDSFDAFCESLPSLFRETDEFSVEKEGKTAAIRFRNAYLKAPEVRDPWEARNGDRSYALRLHADIEAKLYDSKKVNEFRHFPDVFMGEIPCMIGSKLCNTRIDERRECSFDLGGYFIIDGAEKVIVPQEANFAERCTISRKGDAWKVYVGHPTKGLSWWKAMSRVVLNKKTNTLDLYLSGADPIPVVIALRALEVTSDKAVMDVLHATNDPELAELVRPSLEEAKQQINSFEVRADGDLDLMEADHRDSNKNMEFVASKTERDFHEMLFPDLPSAASKAIYLGYIVAFLCSSYLGRRPIRDNNLVDKRVMGVNELFKLMLTKSVRRFMKEACNKILDKRGLSDKFLDSRIVTMDFRSGFKQGIWADPRIYKTGVVEPLTRHNCSGTLAHFRHVRAPATYTGRIDGRRYPNESFTGRFCPVETPEGQNCGLLKTLSMFASISSHRSEKDVIDNVQGYFQELDRVSPRELNSDDVFHVFINGRLLGLSQMGPLAAKHLRGLRRRGVIHPEVEIAMNNYRELHIFTDGGRILRPFFVVERNQILLTKMKLFEMKRLSNAEKISYLLAEGIVELLGPEEEEESLIALTPQDLSAAGDTVYTHMELHPVGILSISASLIPFLHHNQSIRVTHQSQKHSKQAIGIYSCNTSRRFDTTSDELFYPQKQLVSTRISQLLGRNELMNGQACVVAVASYEGFNQEDSLILNQASLDRGLFRSMRMRTHRHSINSNTSNEKFERPGDPEGGPDRRYLHLDSAGFPDVGAQLRASHAVIGKTSMSRESSVRKDSSLFLKNFEQGTVKQVVLSSKSDTSSSVKVKVGTHRSPQVGDKFSSLHGQKGVVGCCMSQEDLLFTQQGIVPDVIINPHAFPTRQTLGQMFESIAGKARAIGLKPVSTPFASNTPEELAAALHSCGFQKWGNEKFYSGLYGTAIGSHTFVGVCYYQRLIHMAEDRIKWRRIGKNDEMTKQPIRDRQRYGGIQFSEMERHSLVGHGAAASIQERMFYLSDPHQVEVCTLCHRMASMGRSREPECSFCKDKFPSFVSVEIPYSCKRLVQELYGMGIDLRLITSD